MSRIMVALTMMIIIEEGKAGCGCYCGPVHIKVRNDSRYTNLPH